MDLTGVIGRPALMGFIAATQAEQLERCYPTRSILTPHEVLLTRWSEDPFASGSYSLAAIGSNPGMRAELAQCWGAMVFAGEAVNTNNPASLQGAYLSGIQAAQTLLARRCNNTPHLWAPIVHPARCGDFYGLALMVLRRGAGAC